MATNRFERAASRRHEKSFMCSVAMLLALVVALMGGEAHAQYTQQGPKLVGRDTVGPATHGYAVALSGDGNTAIVGGNDDNSSLGAAWIYTRAGGVWAQQGPKLVGAGAVGSSQQGISVAIAADGNTAVVGAWGDNGSIGAAWVYTRSGTVWTQQGPKLVGTGGVGPFVTQGFAVAISAAGDTIMMGGGKDNSSIGGAWVFSRSGGVWTQQGAKLVGTGAVGPAEQGTSVALSADGNTALVGGNSDNGGTGAVWVFTRSGGVWTQQGSKLVGAGAQGTLVQQGWRVGLSADGNTAILGGFGDEFIGAAWVFTRNGEFWSQQGPKLVGTGFAGSNIGQGWSVGLAGDGNTAIVGGPGDGSAVGAAWVFTRSGNVWTQYGAKLVGSGAAGAAQQGSSVALSRDGTTALVGAYSDDARVGAAWVYTRPQQAPPARPLYRFNTGTNYFYTGSETEKNYVLQNFPKWVLEGVAYHVFIGPTFNTLPVYRFNAGAYHFYTISEVEKNYVLQNFPGWALEGIAFWTFGSSAPQTLPVYRFNTGISHFYTISESEKNYVLQNFPAWILEGIAYYARTVP